MNRRAKTALRTILQRAKAGRLGAITRDGACMYRRGTKYCAIGCLLTPAEHKEIVRQYMETSPVYDLFRTLPSVQERTGLSIGQAAVLQNAHDASYSIDAISTQQQRRARQIQFVEGVTKCLGAGKIDPRYFRDFS